MEKTLELLKEELKRKEYQPLAEELNKYEKYTERKMVKKKALVVFSKNEQEITEIFIKEFKKAKDQAEAYISLAEQFIPKKEKTFEDVLIGRLWEKSEEKLFSTDEEVVTFTRKIVPLSQVGIWGMSHSESLYKRAERHIEENEKEEKGKLKTVFLFLKKQLRKV